MPVEVEFDPKKASTRFIEVRTNNHLTQGELAEKLGVAEQTVKNYEKAGSPNVRDAQNNARQNAIAGMKIETLFKMAKLFNVSADYLLGISHIPCTNPDMQSAIQYTGLSKEAIEMIKYLQESHDLTRSSFLKTETLNWLLSNPRFTLNLINYLVDYRMNAQIYIAANNTYKKEIAELEKLTNGDVIKEVQVKSSGEFVFTVEYMDVMDRENNKDLSLLRVNRQFASLLDELIDKLCDKTSNLDRHPEEEIL